MFEDKIYIIAEAGVNHNGDINLAKKLIDAGKAAGVDCVKFQTWKTEALLSADAPKAAYQIANDGEGSQFEMLKKLELSYPDFKELQAYSKQAGVTFLSTPDEQESLDFLVDELNLPLIKVGSGEINNLLYLKQIARKKRPVILSTGMCNLADVERAYLTLVENGAPEVAILHCTSEYPAPLETVNLKAMDTLKDAFKVTVGYSDHTDGIAISLAAAARGARIIEKHFTLDKNMEGPDHKASLDPTELKALVDGIRAIESALGDGIKRIQEVEKATQLVVKKGIYAKSNLKAGDIITEEHLVGKRPVAELGMEEYESIIGKRLAIDLEKDTAISRKHISWD
nr:N-acetylneuraminate synthase [uncultured Fluviicola sp.]